MRRGRMSKPRSDSFAGSLAANCGPVAVVGARKPHPRCRPTSARKFPFLPIASSMTSAVTGATGLASWSVLPPLRRTPAGSRRLWESFAGRAVAQGGCTGAAGCPTIGPTFRSRTLQVTIAGSCDITKIANFSGGIADPLPKVGISHSMEAIKLLIYNGDPYGTRTRVFAVRGRRPRPLDEGAALRCGVAHMGDWPPLSSWRGRRAGASG